MWIRTWGRLLPAAGLLAGVTMAAQVPPADARPGGAADQAVVLRTTTSLVQVHAVARDSDGKAVTGLKKEDFELLDNGIPQQIALFAAETAAPAASVSAPAAFPAETPSSEGAGGYAAILIDHFGSSMEDSAVAWSYLNRMLKNFDPGTKFALFAVNGWEAKQVAAFGAGRDELRDKLSRLIWRAPPPCYSSWACARMHAITTTLAFEFVAEHLQFAPGRKALIWLSDGAGAPSPGLQSMGDLLPGQTVAADAGDLTPDTSAELDRIIQRMNSADIAVYPVRLGPCCLPSNDPRIALFKSYAALTGGVAYYNRNDLDAVVREAVEDVRATYSLSYYAPPGAAADEFHRITVKTARPGVTLSYKQGYFPGDRYQSAAAETASIPGAEARAAALQMRARMAALPDVKIMVAGSIGASMHLPFFYLPANAAVVDLAMDIETANLKFQTVDGQRRAEVHLAVEAMRADGAVAARFTDTLKLAFATDAEVEAFRRRPYPYQRQFRLAPGEYNVQAALSAGQQDFGKADAPLRIPDWDGKRLALSGIALGKEARPATAAIAGLDAAALEGRKALSAHGIEIIPSGSRRFERGGQCRAYFEIYDAAPATGTPRPVSVQFRVLDAATGDPKADSGLVGVSNLARAGSGEIPVSLAVPISTLAPGSYKLEVKAVHSPGPDTAIGTVDFEVE